jgi:hypothetical protein
MKPNGKKFVVRVALFAVCAVCLLSGLANAETVRGTFKLPTKACWGQMVLEPGEYEFAVDTDSLDRVITVRSKDTGRGGMVISEGFSDARSAGSSLNLAKSEDGLYVRSIYLGDLGLALNFAVPKAALAKLVKSTPATIGSASGTH